MVTHQNEQKLWNLTQMRKHWWSSVWHQAKTLLPGMLVAVAIASWAIPVLSGSILEQSPELSTALPLLKLYIGLSFTLRFLLLLPFGLLLMAPLVFSCCGEWPTQKHVDINRRLRRAMGMSDDVSTSTEINH